jgi:hypothetical protein
VRAPCRVPGEGAGRGGEKPVESHEKLGTGEEEKRINWSRDLPIKYDAIFKTLMTGIGAICFSIFPVGFVNLTSEGHPVPKGRVS